MKVFSIDKELRCYICGQPIHEWSQFQVLNFRDHKRRLVNYGRCGVDSCFDRRVMDGSDPDRPRFEIFASMTYL
jgi:hypothetical protein